jgi:hypothetical protein
LRRPDWPSGLGIVLEWVETKVDPFGGDLPKVGVFYVANDDANRAIRSRLAEELKVEGGFAGMGYKIAGESVWPALKYVPKSSEWWKDPDAWSGTIATDVIALWDKAAPVISRTLAVSR